MAADNAIRKSLVAKGYSAGDVNDVSTAFLSATGLSATSGAAAKTVDVVNNENKKSTEADKRAEEDFQEANLQLVKLQQDV